jgi:hypothetical protein
MTIIKPGTVVYALTFAITVLSTSLIIFRILRVPVARKSNSESGGRYRQIMELLIESSALYSVSVIAVLVFWVKSENDVVGRYPIIFVEVVMDAMIVSILLPDATSAEDADGLLIGHRAHAFVCEGYLWRREVG